MAGIAGLDSCVHDWSYEAAAGVQAGATVKMGLADIAVQVALALYQRKSARSIADMQYNISDRQTKLAEALHEHAKKYWAAEKSLVGDVFAEQKYKAMYSARSQGWGDISRESMKASMQYSEDSLKQACLPKGRCDSTRWRRVAGETQADIMSFADRQEESREQVLNDRRYARQYGVLGLGRDKLRAIASFQSISGSVAFGAAKEMADMINGAHQAFGYVNEELFGANGWGRGFAQRMAEENAKDQGLTAPHAEPLSSGQQISPVNFSFLSAPKQPAKRNNYVEKLTDDEILRRTSR
jgi:hypothetical protein